MKAQPFKQSTPGDERSIVSDVIEEALQKHAASRPTKKPPRPMPVTPVLPRVPKPHKRRGG